MRVTRRASTRHRNPAHEAMGRAKFRRASSAYRHPGCVTVAARILLTEPRAPGSEPMSERVKAKLPDVDPTSVSEAATAAVAEMTKTSNK